MFISFISDTCIYNTARTLDNTGGILSIGRTHHDTNFVSIICLCCMLEVFASTAFDLLRKVEKNYTELIVLMEHEICWARVSHNGICGLIHILPTIIVNNCVHCNNTNIKDKSPCPLYPTTIPISKKLAIVDYNAKSLFAHKC